MMFRLEKLTEIQEIDKPVKKTGNKFSSKFGQ